VATGWRELSRRIGPPEAQGMKLSLSYLSGVLLYSRQVGGLEPGVGWGGPSPLQGTGASEHLSLGFQVFPPLSLPSKLLVLSLLLQQSACSRVILPKGRDFDSWLLFLPPFSNPRTGSTEAFHKLDAEKQKEGNPQITLFKKEYSGGGEGWRRGAG
jgi:hypothetical protein